MKYLFIFLPFLCNSQTYYRPDSIVEYGGEAAVKRFSISIEVVKDTSFITARREEIIRQLSDLENELLYLEDLRAQYEAVTAPAMLRKAVLPKQKATKKRKKQ